MRAVVLILAVQGLAACAVAPRPPPGAEGLRLAPIGDFGDEVITPRVQLASARGRYAVLGTQRAELLVSWGPRHAWTGACTQRGQRDPATIACHFLGWWPGLPHGSLVLEGAGRAPLRGVALGAGVHLLEGDTRARHGPLTDTLTITDDQGALRAILSLSPTLALWHVPDASGDEVAWLSAVALAIATTGDLREHDDEPARPYIPPPPAEPLALPSDQMELAVHVEHLERAGEPLLAAALHDHLRGPVAAAPVLGPPTLGFVMEVGLGGAGRGIHPLQRQEGHTAPAFRLNTGMGLELWGSLQLLVEAEINLSETVREPEADEEDGSRVGLRGNLVARYLFGDGPLRPSVGAHAGWGSQPVRRPANDPAGVITSYTGSSFGGRVGLGYALGEDLAGERLEILTEIDGTWRSWRRSSLESGEQTEAALAQLPEQARTFGLGANLILRMVF